MQFFLWALGKKRITFDSFSAVGRIEATVSEAMRGGLLEEEATFAGWKPFSYIAAVIEFIFALIREVLFALNNSLEIIEKALVPNDYVSRFIFSGIYFFVKLPFLLMQMLLDIVIILAVEPFTRMPRNLKQLLTKHEGNEKKIYLGTAFLVSTFISCITYEVGGYSLLANTFANTALYITYAAAWKIILLVAAVFYLPSLIGQLLFEYRKYNASSMSNMPINDGQHIQTDVPAEDSNSLIQSIDHNPIPILQVTPIVSEGTKKYYQDWSKDLSSDNPNFKWPEEKKLTWSNCIKLSEGSDGEVYKTNSATVIKVAKYYSRKYLKIELFALIRINNHPAVEKYPYVITPLCFDLTNYALEVPLASEDLSQASLKVVSFDIQKQWMDQIAKGLHLIHKAGIMHGDLKTKNILVFQNNDIKICDFGFAKTRSEIEAKEGGNNDGTTFYLSPEIIAYYFNGPYPYSVKCDIYALGLVCAEIVMQCDAYNTIDGSVETDALMKVLYHLLCQHNSPLSSIHDKRSPFKNTSRGCSKPITDSFSLLVHQCCAPKASDRPTPLQFVGKLNHITSFVKR